MVNLRGHHLICLNFFSGEGFSEEFINNLNDIKKQTSQGEIIKTGTQADDICKMCYYLKNGKCLYNENSDIEITNMDETAMALLKIGKDTSIKWREINIRLPFLFKFWYEKYCNECDWLNICKKNEDFLKLMSNLKERRKLI